MLVISTREFRANQRQYLGRASKSEDVILKSRTEGSFKLVPVSDDDTLMSKEKLDSIIEQGLQDIKKRQNQTIYIGRTPRKIGTMTYFVELSNKVEEHL